MRVATGTFDKDGVPCLSFELSAGRLGTEQSGATLKAIIDTGFAGFVSMPLERAFAFKLALEGYSVVQLADGHTAPKLTCRGYARIGGRSEEVTVMLEPESDEVLIGVALLRALGLALLMTRNEVWLLDQDAIDDFVGAGPAGGRMRDSASRVYSEIRYLS